MQHLPCSLPDQLSQPAQAPCTPAPASSSLSMGTRAAPSTTVCPPLGWCWMALFSATAAEGDPEQSQCTCTSCCCSGLACLEATTQPSQTQPAVICHPPHPCAPWMRPASRRPGAVSASRSRSCSLYTWGVEGWARVRLRIFNGNNHLPQHPCPRCSAEGAPCKQSSTGA